MFVPVLVPVHFLLGILPFPPVLGSHNHPVTNSPFPFLLFRSRFLKVVKLVGLTLGSLWHLTGTITTGQSTFDRLTQLQPKWFDLQVGPVNAVIIVLLIFGCISLGRRWFVAAKSHHHLIATVDEALYKWLITGFKSNPISRWFD